MCKQHVRMKIKMSNIKTCHQLKTPKSLLSREVKPDGRHQFCISREDQ